MKLKNAIKLLEFFTKKKVQLIEYVQSVDTNKVMEIFNTIIINPNHKKFVATDDDTVNPNVRIQVYFNSQNLDKINPLIKKAKTLGWFPASVSPDNEAYIKFNKSNLTKIITMFNQVIIMFEKYYDEEVKYNVLYHATPTANMPKIEQKGLLPRHKNKLGTTPPRIYFATSFNAAENIAYQLADFEKGKKSSSYTIISIKQTDLPENIKFYSDPDYGPGVYTYQPIPPEYIRATKTLEL